MEEQSVNLQEDMKAQKEPNTKEHRKLLSPCNIPAEDTSHLAVDDLRFALEHTDSRNIAITGHYGSGKSSVANTCIDEMGIGEEVLRISMSTFSLTPDEEQHSDEIEYKIVQHLLYKCDKSKIPYSRFQLLHHVERKQLEKYILLTLLAIGCFIIAFEPTILRIDSFYKAYDWFFGLFGKNGVTAGKVVNVITDTLCIVYLVWYLFKVGVNLASKLNRFGNFKIEAKGVSMEASAETSVFNKYLEEILYIIQANQYNYILFEDLDRLNNSDKLFLKIRELNMLINESEAFKSQKRVVRFIYAIRDDVFTRELRTKCFDYIVAVVPVVDQYNVTDYLIKEYKGNGLFKTIETPVLEQLLSKVSGLRELKNIVNEYTLFEKSLRTHMGAGSDNYEQKLLAVVVYKNLYPQDFAKAYSKHGLFYGVFRNKKLFYESQTKDLRDKWTTAIKIMEEAREKIVSARKRYLEKMNDGLTVTKLIKDGYDYTLEQVANKDNLFELFENNDFDKYAYIEDDHETVGESDYDFSFEDLEKKVTKDIDYHEFVYNDQERYFKANESRISLGKEIKVLENTSLRELIKELGTQKTTEILNTIYIEEYPVKDEKSKPEVNADMVDTLQTMLFGGYITEDYYLYITKFYEGSTSESDYQFRSSILQGTEWPYDHKLNNVKSVVSKLRVENFKDRSVLNYDILNYLLENKQEHFLPTFIETARNTPKFIVDYSQLSDTVNDEFFMRAFDGWDSCVKIIRDQEKAEDKEELLRLFFKVSPTTVKLKDEEKEYLEGRYEFINNSIQVMDIGKLKKFVKHFGLVFESLVKPNIHSQDFYRYCLTNKRFVISKRNLEVILGEDFGKKPMTAILGLEDDHLKKYLLTNQKNIVKMFDGVCDEESRESIVYMIKEKVADDDWLINYICGQQYSFDSVGGLDSRAVELVLKADKMVVSWGLVLDVINMEGELTVSLNDYIGHHVNELSRSKCIGPQGLLDILHSQLFAGEKQPFDSFKKLIGCFMQDFTLDEIKNLTDAQIAEVIRQKKVVKSADLFDYLCLNRSNYVADSYLQLYFDSLLDDDEIDWNQCVRNSMGIHILSSKLTLIQKKRFMDEVLFIKKGQPDTEELGKLVCFYYNLCGVSGADESLVIDALTVYISGDSWESKIKLVNKCNATWAYKTELENKLLSSLGGEYLRLTYPRGWAHFDINEHNETLLTFLKVKGHFINNFESKDGQFYVTFKHS